MTGGLFNPEAFEQMPGQMSMDQTQREGMRLARRQFEQDARVQADALNMPTVTADDES